MVIVLAVAWLLALCLPIMAAETVQRFDTNADVHIDQREFYEEDALTRLEKDRDNDQGVDHWSTYKDGKAVQAELDIIGLGAANERECYGDDGALLRVTRDEDGDGKAHQIIHIDVEGRITRVL